MTDTTAQLLLISIGSFFILVVALKIAARKAAEKRIRAQAATWNTAMVPNNPNIAAIYYPQERPVVPAQPARAIPCQYCGSGKAPVDGTCPACGAERL